MVSAMVLLWGYLWLHSRNTYYFIFEIYIFVFCNERIFISIVRKLVTED